MRLTTDRKPDQAEMLFGDQGKQGFIIGPAIYPSFPTGAAEELLHHGQA